ncbi:MAG: circadian clock protein KaiB [Promethearchaeota archaeon]|nr:MAG: circadian clock protein KaiB [Candidatus Lokiarchaeota archaeon]
MSNTTFYLFIAGKKDPKSQKVVKNLKKICKEEGITDDLFIIDITENPHIAESLRIIATPLLMKTSPEPIRTFIGDFSNFKSNFFIDTDQDSN